MLSRLPVVGDRVPVGRWRRELFDAAVARNVDPADTLHVSFSGVALKSIQRANEHGVTTIVERCSSHARTQANILEEEYRRHGYDSGPSDEAYVRREEAEYDAAEYVMVPSEFVYESFLEQGVPEEKVLCEPYAVDPNQYTPTSTESDGPLTFLFAGRVELRKGIPYLLDAWDRLDLPGAQLKIAGGIKESGQQFADEYADRDDIEFLGWVSDMDRLYEDASVFVLPTLEEGSAYVTYEAMASGLPVVTTPHAGWVGTDGEHGIEVPIREVDALATAMKGLADDPDRRSEMGSNARDLIETSYTWDAYGERVYERYRSLIDDGETRR
ncbi:glycosyltransferase family 4 protein [Halomicrobium katesii]|uniref:glycosyltransferase family 4 protein n=1 Tax=Halomicrobium katesii TaxID=437163 RepID=UPI001B7FD769|nr:glycosyltransferase family 4 protein [Halomicrobium katesii]